MEFVLPEMTERREENLALARRELAKIKKWRDGPNGYNLNHFGFILVDGGKKIYKGQPCYGAFPLALRPEDRDGEPWCDYVIDYHQTHRWQEDKNTLAYADWLLNHSVYAGCYVDKDPEQVLVEGAVLNTHYPAKFLIQAMIAFRYIFEFHDRIETWAILKEGMNEDCALVFMHYFYRNQNVWKEAHPNGNHNFLDNRLGQAALRRFLSRDFSQFPDDAVYTGNTSYHGMTTIWNSEEDYVSARDEWHYERGTKRPIVLPEEIFSIKSEGWYSTKYIKDLPDSIPAILRTNGVEEYAK